MLKDIKQGFAKSALLFLELTGPWSAVMLAGGGLFWLTSFLSLKLSFLLSLSVGVAAVAVACTKTQRLYGYSLALGGFSTLIVLLYYGYYTLHFISASFFFYSNVVIALAAISAAVLLRGWLLAVFGVVVGSMAPALVFSLFSPLGLIGYFSFFLSLVFLIGYAIDWPELALFSFGGYVLYHPVIFALVSMEPKKGALLLNDAFWFLGFILVLYTGIPWLYNLVWPRLRSIDMMLVTIGGAYSFAAIRMLLRDQLRLVEQFHFLRVLYRPPKYIDLLMYLFVIYAVVYVILFFVGHLLRKKNGVQAVLLTLALVSAMGAVAILNRKQKIVLMLSRKTMALYKQQLS